MKLYIKANNLKILKNIDTLLPSNLSKTSTLLDANSLNEYRVNLQSAKELQKYQEQIFYDTRELSKLVKGIYFGNSSCEHLMPQVREIVEALEFCKGRHYNFVFVFAPLSQNKLEEARFICDMLNRQEGCEVVVNDIGILQLVLEYKNLKPILGLNFTKIIKNAFLGNVAQNDISKSQFKNQQKLLSSCEFENESVRVFYKSLGIGRFSLENVDIDVSFLNKSHKMQVDLYYPYITLANSKACDIAGSFEDERGYFVFDECSKYCNFTSLEFKNSDVLGIRQRYNTLYKTEISLEVQKELYKESRNRLVWELFL